MRGTCRYESTPYCRFPRRVGYINRNYSPQRKLPSNTASKLPSASSTAPPSLSSLALSLKDGMITKTPIPTRSHADHFHGRSARCRSAGRTWSGAWPVDSPSGGLISGIVEVSMEIARSLLVGPCNRAICGTHGRPLGWVVADPPKWPSSRPLNSVLRISRGMSRPHHLA